MKFPKMPEKELEDAILFSVFAYQTSKRGWKKQRLGSKQLSIAFAMQTWIISNSITNFPDIAWLNGEKYYSIKI